MEGRGWRDGWDGIRRSVLSGLSDDRSGVGGLFVLVWVTMGPSLPGPDRSLWILTVLLESPDFIQAAMGNGTGWRWGVLPSSRT